MGRPQRKAKVNGVIPRQRREGRIPFGRSSESSTSGDLTDLGCPDCRGVLAVREEGRLKHLSFRCSIGHGYSGESLIKSKEEQLEDTLWSAVEVFQEVVLLHREMADRARADGARDIATAYQRRAQRAAQLSADLRRIIAEDSPASAERVKG